MKNYFACFCAVATGLTGCTATPSPSAQKEMKMTVESKQTDLKAILEAALDDERKAESFYAAVLKKHGDIRPFINIIEAERRHAEAVIGLMERRGWDVPENPYNGTEMAPATLAEACRMAITAEEENIALYDRLLPTVTEDDVKFVLTNLQRASRENHLPAFTRCLARQSG